MSESEQYPKHFKFAKYMYSIMRSGFTGCWSKIWFRRLWHPWKAEPAP